MRSHTLNGDVYLIMTRAGIGDWIARLFDGTNSVLQVVQAPELLSRDVDQPAHDSLITGWKNYDSRKACPEQCRRGAKSAKEEDEREESGGAFCVLWRPGRIFVDHVRRARARETITIFRTVDTEVRGRIGSTNQKRTHRGGAEGRISHRRDAAESAEEIILG